MRTKMVVIGAFCAVIVAAVVVATVLEQAAAAQAARQQVPLFEPDPLWSQALPNKWVTGQVGGVAVDSHDNLWVFHRPDTIPDGEKGRGAQPAAGGVLHSGARRAGIRHQRQVPPGVGRLRAPAIEWPPRSTGSSSTTRTTSG